MMNDEGWMRKEAGRRKKKEKKKSPFVELFCGWKLFAEAMISILHEKVS